jgi:putative sterol carrier protein
MSDVLKAAIEAINNRLGEDGFDGSIKVEIEDEGALIIDQDGARASDEDADCTMTADADTLQGMLEGDVNPAGAFMSGKLQVEGDMSMAMKLGAALA